MNEKRQAIADAAYRTVYGRGACVMHWPWLSIQNLTTALTAKYYEGLDIGSRANLRIDSSLVPDWSAYLVIDGDTFHIDIPSYNKRNRLSVHQNGTATVSWDHYVQSSSARRWKEDLVVDMFDDATSPTDDEMLLFEMVNGKADDFVFDVREEFYPVILTLNSAVLKGKARVDVENSGGLDIWA